MGQTEPGAPVDYRHIVRADGGHNGGMLVLTDQMVANGARPCWLGYLHVADVDAAVSAIVADGGKVLMPKMTIPEGRWRCSPGFAGRSHLCDDPGSAARPARSRQRCL